MDETLVPLDLSDAIAMIERQQGQIDALTAERDRLAGRVRQWAFTAAVKQKQLSELCHEIERLPPSEQQTKISLMASDLFHKEVI